MNRPFLIAALLVSALAAQARSLVVTLTDGTKAYFQLADGARPVMKFMAGRVSVDSQTFTIADIRDFRLSAEDAPTGIQSVETGVRPDGESLWIASESPLAVYDSQGRKQPVDLQRLRGGQRVSLSALPRGLYIIHVGKSTFKVVKK